MCFDYASRAMMSSHFSNDHFACWRYASCFDRYRRGGKSQLESAPRKSLPRHLSTHSTERMMAGSD